MASRGRRSVMPDVDRELCEAEELKDFIVRNRLLHVETTDTKATELSFCVV